MLHFLRSTFRQWIKQPVSSALCLFGLAASFGLSILVLMQANDMRRYGSDVPDRDRLFFADTLVLNDGKNSMRYQGLKVTASDYARSQPTIDGVAIYNERTGILFEGSNRYQISIHLALADYPQIFPKATVEGDWLSTMQSANQVAISYEAALRIFGKASGLVGKAISLSVTDGRLPYQIGAVLKKGQTYDAFQADFYYGNNPEKQLQTLREEGQQFRTLIKLKEGVALEEYESGTTDHINEILSPKTNTWGSGTILYIPGSETFGSRLGGWGTNEFTILSAIAGVLLLLAIVNFAAFSTSLVLSRQREVNLRKVVGASRKNLVLMFILEACLFSFVAFGVGLLLAADFADRLSSILTSSIDVFSAQRWPEYALSLGMLLITIMLVSLYPLYLVNGSKVGPALRASGSSVFGFGNKIRSVFVFLQTMGAIGFLFFATTVTAQADHMANRDRGMDAKHLYNIDLKGLKPAESFLFRDRVKAIPSVKEAALSGTPLYGKDFSYFGQYYFSKDTPTPNLTRVDFVDKTALDLIGAKLVAGKLPRPDNVSEEEKEKPLLTRQVMVEADTLTQFGLPAIPDEAIGQCIYHYPPNKDRTVCLEVAGVLKPISKVKASQFTASTGKIFFGMDSQFKRDYVNLNLFVDIQKREQVEAISAIQSIFEEMFPDAYFVLQQGDQLMNEMLERDIAMKWLTQIANLTILIIAVTGAFALVQNMIAQRSRELALRRVLGARTAQVLSHLTIRLLKPVLPALVIGLIGSLYLSQQWLEGFHLRIDPPYGLVGILVVGLLILYGGLAAIGTGRVLSRKPAQVLYHE